MRGICGVYLRNDISSRLIAVLARVGLLVAIAGAASGSAQDMELSLGLQLGQVEVGAVAVDDHGNIYVSGSFEGEVDIDPGPGEFLLTSQESSGASFIMKLDANGALVWAGSIGGGTMGYPGGITLDNEGNVFLGGTFNRTMDVDPGPDVVELRSIGWLSVYLIKLNPSGQFQWARTVADGNYSQLGNLVLDTEDNIYVTGSFDGTVDLDPGENTFTVIAEKPSDFPIGWNYSNGFVVKLDPDGNLVWAGVVEADGGSSCTALALAPDRAVIVGGGYGGTADLDPGPEVLEATHGGSGDSFVLMLAEDGSLEWATTYGGPTRVRLSQLEMDHAGNILLGGHFQNTADFDPGPDRFELTATGEEDIFIQKLDRAGRFIWAVSMGGHGNPHGIGLGEERLTSLNVDGAENIYSAGYVTGTADLDPGDDVINVVPGPLFVSAFLQKLDRDGDFQWVKSLGMTGASLGGGIEIGQSGELIATGHFVRSVDIDPGPSVAAMFGPDDNYEGYLLRLHPVDKAPSVLSQMLLDVLLASDAMGLEDDTLDLEEARSFQPSLTQFEFSNWDADNDGLLTIAELTARAEDSFGCFAARENAAGRIQDNLGDLITLGLALGTLALLRGGIARERG